jgi:hypothetical protein
MNSKTGVAFSIIAIAAVIALFGEEKKIEQPYCVA